MFSVGWLAAPPEEQQSVLPGSLGVCLAPWPYHWAVPTRFQLGWCQGSLQASPSHQSQHQWGMLCKLWQCVVEGCHAETSLPLDDSARVAPLVVAGFRPCTTLHWGSLGSQQDQYGAIQKSHPTPWEMHALYICLFHWCMGLPVFRLFIFFSHSLSSINPLKHEPAFTKVKSQDVEVRCLGGQHYGMQHWQKCDFEFLTGKLQENQFDISALMWLLNFGALLMLHSGQQCHYCGVNCYIHVYVPISSVLIIHAHEKTDQWNEITVKLM